MRSLDPLSQILSRSSADSPAQACTGTILSTGLVLTGADCVMQGGKRYGNIDNLNRTVFP